MLTCIINVAIGAILLAIVLLIVRLIVDKILAQFGINLASIWPLIFLLCGLLVLLAFLGCLAGGGFGHVGWWRCP